MIMHLLSKIFLGKRKTGKEMNIEILNTLVILESLHILIF